jgi:taurine dioxygenase
MNYKMHDNGWTVIITDLDLRTATQEDINHIARLIATHTCVVVRNQTLNLDEEVRVVNMFKDPERKFTTDDPMYRKVVIPGSDDKVIRVTGELNEHGEQGLAGEIDDLDWHCNEPASPTRKEIVWLYALQGSAGSVTTWNNNVLSYADLDQDTKDMLDPLEAIVGYDADRMNNINTHGLQTYINDEYTPKIVRTNIAGNKGLYFPFLQIFGFKGKTEEESKHILKTIGEHTIQPKYCYDHHWQDGDILISEQWLGIHKRWKFENMATRMLHRAAFDFPDQDYK